VSDSGEESSSSESDDENDFEYLAQCARMQRGPRQEGDGFSWSEAVYARLNAASRHPWKKRVPSSSTAASGTRASRRRRSIEKKTQQDSKRMSPLYQDRHLDSRLVGLSYVDRRHVGLSSSAWSRACTAADCAERMR
jgi:hypothetical protein